MLFGVSETVWMELIKQVATVALALIALGTLYMQYLTKRAVDVSTNQSQKYREEASKVRVDAAEKVEEVRQKLYGSTTERLDSLTAMVEELHAANCGGKSDQKK